MDRVTRLKSALILNAGIVVVQVIGAYGAHSLGLLSDAGHNLVDVTAFALSLLAVRLASRAPTERRSFGFHRSGVLAAQVNAATILLLTGWIGYEAIRRLIHPAAVDGPVVVAIAGVSLAANAVAAWLLHDRSGDLNMRAALLHAASDAAASAGVAAAGLVMWAVAGAYWLDPLASLVIGLLIAVRAVMLLVETTNVLMEATPSGLDLAELATAVRAVRGVEDVHDLHAWSLSSHLLALSAHVVLPGQPDLAEAQEIGRDVRAMLAVQYGIDHATLEFECSPCGDVDEEPCSIRRLPAGSVTVHDH